MINEHKFGFFRINNKPYYGDIKILDKKVKTWDNREHHDLNLNQIKDLLEINPNVIIIGTGNSGLLKMSTEAQAAVLSKRIELFAGKNTDAIQKYNEAISKNKKIAALFHATC